MKKCFFPFSLIALIIVGSACTKSKSSGSDSKEELMNDTLSINYDIGSEFNPNGYTIKVKRSDSLIPVAHDSFKDSSKKDNHTIGLRTYNVLFRDEKGGCYSNTQFIPYNEERADSNSDKRYIFLQYRY